MLRRKTGLDPDTKGQVRVRSRDCCLGGEIYTTLAAARVEVVATGWP